MNIFELRDSVIKDYRDYVEGFVEIKDPKIREVVDESLNAGLLWPDPIIQLNPSFESGDSFEQLIADDVLLPRCAQIFVDEGKPLTFYRHQTEAFKRARRGENYILTTGTGSGKSLTYIVPIVDAILRNGSGQGVQAIVVYPMNALANSQLGELQKFLNQEDAFGNKIESPITFRRYTGQESLEEKDEIRNNPPDVILTNYMMLELMLTRADEVDIVKTFNKLRFLVLDELHSYRGRQGADVAMLARRVIEASGSKQVICVGTSATLAAEGTREDANREVAKVASAIFGQTIKPENVINEYLTRQTPERDFNAEHERDALKREVQELALAAKVVNDPESADAALRAAINNADSVEDALKRSLLASWIESNLGVKRDPKSGDLVRQEPKTIDYREERPDDEPANPNDHDKSLARTLGAITKLDRETCVEAIKFLLLRGAQVKNQFGKTFFPFKLHQFVGRGENAYATAELGPNRKIYMQKQVFAPDSDRKKKLYPLVFCVHCGQEYYCVTKTPADLNNPERYDAREPYDAVAPEPTEKENVGFLYIPEDQSLTPERLEKILWDALPEDWKDDEDFKKERKPDLPIFKRINPLGEVVGFDDPDGINAYFVHSPFRVCPECGVAYAPQSARTTTSDPGRVSSLTVGGRSTATTILALSVEERLFQFFPKPEDRSMRKLLSFTDNRQDASLQAGHFNDFIEVAALRGALCKALQRAGDEEITYDNIAQRVFDALELKQIDYALALQSRGDEENGGASNLQPPKELKGTARQNLIIAMKLAIKYRVMRDLRRGWRILVPNLEQTALLEIEYADLDELANDQEEWENEAKTLRDAKPQTRKELIKRFLDELRGELAIGGDELIRDKQDDMIKAVRQHVTTEWGFDESDSHETLYHSRLAYPGSKPKTGADPSGLYISYRGLFGKAIVRILREEEGVKPNSEEQDEIIASLFRVCAGAYGLLEKKSGYGNAWGYQLKPSALRWKRGSGKLDHYDKTRQVTRSAAGDHINEFFKAFYEHSAINTGRLFAREHTAQVDATTRDLREKQFRKGIIPILFCSPTMELGVDISTLNVVHMRNIPPTPANYAQRSGRAGRSGQSALALVYGSSFSQHDRYYFNRPNLVVSGSVKPPQIDLSNEDLILSHVRAIWLSVAASEKRFSLGAGLFSIVAVPQDLEDDSPCAVKPEALDVLRDPKLKALAKKRIDKVLQSLKADESLDLDWLTDEWLDEKLVHLERDFIDACQRWITLYTTARDQQKKHNARANDNRLSELERKESQRIRAQAEREMQLLRNESQGRGSRADMSEFYSYRYFAGEGFLPGYNFPRLPVVAYLPGSRQGALRGDRDGYLSRPRFLAISEFGPKAIVYHEGARYMVERASLPLDEYKTGETALAVVSGQLCSECGYYHNTTDEAVDVCENCGGKLDAPLHNLFRLQKVTAKRRERISCDEEERMRYGYDMATSYAFAKRDGKPSARLAEIVLPDGTRWGTLKYGPGATIYRINKGFRRPTKPDSGRIPKEGYIIDVNSGRWLSDKDDANYDSRDVLPIDAKARTQCVRPYVEDVKNCVVLKPDASLNLALDEIASLQAALQRAIERVFSIEDSELAVFPLPNDAKRSELLFYEAAEGGAGVLRKLLDPIKFQEVVREAIDVCHFNPETDVDLRHGPNARENCDAACYDCLLSYGNQRDHALLDRKKAHEILRQLRDATLKVSSTSNTRAEQLRALANQAGSELEKKWLAFLDENELNLPTEAQKELLGGRTRPDFFYQTGSVAVYIDGPPHDADAQRKFDRERRDELEDAGYQVVVFRYDDDWKKIAMEEFADVFGSGK